MVDNPLMRSLQAPPPGGVILFLGAGFSLGATNSNNAPLPSGRDFAKSLAKKSGEPVDTPLNIISEIFNEEHKDDGALVRLLKNTFSTSKITESQASILKYPWKRIYTTNYDDVAEQIGAPDGARPDSFDRETVPISFSDSRRHIVHLNGYVGNINQSTAIDQFGLTLQSYIDKSLFGSPWAGLFRQDISLAGLVIFIGYSMYDTDISYILGSNPDFKKKTVVIQHDSLSNAENRFLARFGDVLKIGTDGFSNLVDQALKNGIAKNDSAGPENFVEITLPLNPNQMSISDIDVENLLIKGIYVREKFWSTQQGPERLYVVPRRLAGQVIEHAGSEGSISIIHSNLGNGKSLAVEQIMYKLLQAGYRVFQFDRKLDNFSFDISYFSNIDNYVLIFEEYIDHDDAVELFVQQLTTSRIVVSGRTSASEVKAVEIFGANNRRVKDFDFNKISSHDIPDIVRILNSGAYWGEYDALKSDSKKSDFIVRNCKSEMQSISLGIVKSTTQHQKVKDFFARPVNSSQAAIILSLVLTYLEIRPTYEFMSDLLSKDLFSVKSELKGSYIGELLSVDAYGVSARSPVLARYILGTFVDDTSIVNVSLDALGNSSAKYARAERYRTFNSKILQYGNISRILRNTANKPGKLTEFYDRAGEFGYKNDSPYYWLQYGIASRFNNREGFAERCYKEALRIASRKQDFYTYKVENSYAEFLLESRMNTEIWDDFAESFVKASSMARNHSYMRETGNYPLKVTGLFAEFIERRQDQFSKSGKEEVIRELNHWHDRIKAMTETEVGTWRLRAYRSAIRDTFDILKF